MKYVNLPPEVLGMIFGELDSRSYSPEALHAELKAARRDLFACSLVHRSWTMEANRVLWRKIPDINMFEDLDMTTKYLGFVESLGVGVLNNRTKCKLSKGQLHFRSLKTLAVLQHVPLNELEPLITSSLVEFKMVSAFGVIDPATVAIAIRSSLEHLDCENKQELAPRIDDKLLAILLENCPYLKRFSADKSVWIDCSSGLLLDFINARPWECFCFPFTRLKGDKFMACKMALVNKPSLKSWGTLMTNNELAELISQQDSNTLRNLKILQWETYDDPKDDRHLMNADLLIKFMKNLVNLDKVVYKRVKSSDPVPVIRLPLSLLLGLHLPALTRVRLYADVCKRNIYDLFRNNPNLVEFSLVVTSTDMCDEFFEECAPRMTHMEHFEMRIQFNISELTEKSISAIGINCRRLRRLLIGIDAIDYNHGAMELSGTDVLFPMLEYVWPAPRSYDTSSCFKNYIEHHMPLAGVLVNCRCQHCTNII